MKRSTSLFVHFLTSHFSSVQTTSDLHFDTFSTCTHSICYSHLDSTTVSNLTLNLSCYVISNDRCVKLRFLNLENINLHLFVVELLQLFLQLVNLTRDHLDYHKTFENYRDAKKAFFDALPREAFAVTNADDRNGMVMVQNTRAQVKTYSARGAADFRGRILEESFEGMNLEMDGREVFVQFVGRFNVSNLLAVYATAVLLGVEPDEALVQLSAMKPVNGRFESIRSPKGVTAIVDYAHTPDALVNVLQTINDVLQHRGECWTVCGAGGNRDRGKRPIMAKVAVENSDRVIITSDNPRFEDPQAIIDDMLAGLSEEQRQSVLSIVDRREAIRTACMLAKPGDVILVAGKGHEDYQIVQGVKHHFDDHEVIREAFGLSDK